MSFWVALGPFGYSIVTYILKYLYNPIRKQYLQKVKEPWCHYSIMVLVCVCVCVSIDIIQF